MRKNPRAGQAWGFRCRSNYPCQLLRDAQQLFYRLVKARFLTKLYANKTNNRTTVSTPTVAAASPPKVAPSVASADSAQTSGTPSPLVSSFGESLNDIIHDPVAPRVRGAGPGTDLLVPQRDCNLWPPPLCVPQFEGRSEVIPRESDLSARLQESEDGRNCTLYPPPSCLPTRKSRSEEDPCCGLPEGTPNCFPKYYGRDVEKTNPQPKSAPVEEKRDVKPRIKIQLPAPDPIDALAAIERREPCCGNPDATPDCWPKFCERDAGAANPQLMPDSIDLLPARAPLDPGLETRGDCDKFPPNTVGCWPKTGSG